MTTTPNEPKQLKKLTLEELIRRKTQGYNDKYKIFTIEIPEIDGTLTCEKKSIETFLRYVEESQEEKLTTREGYDFMKKIIYEHCPVMRSPKLQQAYGCAEPYDIVDEVLLNNLGAIIKCGEEIVKEYGVNMDEVKSKIKN